MTYLQRLRLQKRQRKRLGALIAALSVAVTGTVSWKLHGIGTAMVDETLPENPEGQIRLLSAESGTMFETSAVWEATLPDLGGMETGERIAAVAESQIGYEETAWQFVNDDGEEIQRRYTRYGDWYGNPYGEWNTMFTYFCMKYGGIGEDEVPFGSGCWAWTVELEKNDLIIPVSRGSPHRGDIVFLDTDLDGKADRSGIVTGVNDADGERILTAAEGNVNGAVAELAYSIADEHLAGFLYIGTDARDVLPDAEQDGQQHTGTVFSGVTESGITVKALADETAFPAGTVMQVSDVSRDEALEIAADSLPSASEHLDAVAVDISFVDDDGNELEPAADASVQVQIILPDDKKLPEGELSLLHVPDSGGVQIMEAEITAEGAAFEAESFSMYIITSSNNQVDISTVSTPYTLKSGEQLKVAYSGDYDVNKCRFTVWNNDLDGGKKILNRDIWDYVDNGQKIAAFKGSYPGTSTIVCLYKEDENSSTVTLHSLSVQVPSHTLVQLPYGECANYADQRDVLMQNTFGETYNAFLLTVGDTVTLKYYTDTSLSGYDFGTLASQLEKIGTTTVSTISGPNGYILYEYTQQFRAVQPTTSGSAEVLFGRNGEWGSIKDTIPFTIQAKRDIYLNIDCIHEVLMDIHRGHYNAHPELFVLDDVGNPKYIRNSDTEVLGSADGGFGPYRISSGEEIEVVGYCSADDVNSLDFEVGTKGTHTEGTNLLEKVGESTKERVTSGEHAGEYRITAKFRSKTSSGNKRTGIQFGSGFFYIVVNDDDGEDNVKTHADIEIEDGGSYNMIQYSFDADGNLIKTTTNYSAAVSRVITCDFYGQDGNQLTFLADHSSITNEDKKNEGKPVHFESNDYYAHGTLGSSQYEYTSNYVLDEDASTHAWQKTFENGDTVYLRGNKNFSLKDSKSVIFDVELLLHSHKQTVEVYNPAGTLIWQNTDNNYTGHDIPSFPSKFRLNRQAILDAYNKCPTHTGLDFTLAASAVMLDFQLKKKFIGGDLSTNHFTFKLYDDLNQEVEEATSDDNGIVSFQKIYLNQVGTYTYTVKEVKDSSIGILYADDRELTITVTEQNGVFSAVMDTSQITEPLINYHSYVLPATGGTGTVPFTVTGIALISGAAMLLIRKKRKEAG